MPPVTVGTAGFAVGSTAGPTAGSAVGSAVGSTTGAAVWSVVPPPSGCVAGGAVFLVVAEVRKTHCFAPACGPLFPGVIWVEESKQKFLQTFPVVQCVPYEPNGQWLHRSEVGEAGDDEYGSTVGTLVALVVARVVGFVVRFVVRLVVAGWMALYWSLHLEDVQEHLARLHFWRLQYDLWSLSSWWQASRQMP